MESCQTFFWGALNTFPPPKKSSFFQGSKISQEREFGASQIGIYKKMFLIVQIHLGDDLNSLPAKSVLAEMKHVLFGWYVLKFYVGIVQQILRE
jgi:hypothetical protein